MRVTETIDVVNAAEEEAAARISELATFFGNFEETQDSDFLLFWFNESLKMGCFPPIENFTTSLKVNAIVLFHSSKKIEVIYLLIYLYLYLFIFIFIFILESNHFRSVVK